MYEQFNFWKKIPQNVILEMYEKKKN